MRFCEALTLKSWHVVCRWEEERQRNAQLVFIYSAITAPLEFNGLLIEKFVISHRLKEAQGSWRGAISHQSSFEELR